MHGKYENKEYRVRHKFSDKLQMLNSFRPKNKTLFNMKARQKGGKGCQILRSSFMNDPLTEPARPVGCSNYVEISK